MTTRGARRAVEAAASAAASSTAAHEETDELRFTDERQFRKWLDAVSGDWRRRRTVSTASTATARRGEAADDADGEYCCALSRRCPSTMRVEHCASAAVTTVRFSGEHNHRSVVNGGGKTERSCGVVKEEADTKPEAAAATVPVPYSGSVGQRCAYLAGFEAGIMHERAVADAGLWCLSAEVEKLRLRLADAVRQPPPTGSGGDEDECVEDQKPFAVAAAPPPKKRKFVDASDAPEPSHHCGPAPPLGAASSSSSSSSSSCCSSATSSIAVVAQAPPATPLPYPLDDGAEADAALRQSLSKWYQLPAAVRERKKSVQRERYRRLMATADGCRRLQERARQRYWRNKHGYGGDGNGGDASYSIAAVAAPPSMVMEAAPPPNDVTIKMEAADEIVDVVDVADSPPSLLSKQEQQQQQDDNNGMNINADEKPQQLQRLLHVLQQQSTNTIHNMNNNSLNILAWAAAASTQQQQPEQLQPTAAFGAEQLTNNGTMPWHLFSSYSPLLAAAAAAAASQLPTLRVDKVDYAETFRSSASGSSCSNAEKTAAVAEAKPLNSSGDAATTHSNNNNNNSKWYLLPDEVRERQKQRQRERYRRIMASESGCAILRERARRKYWRNKEKLRQQLDDEAQRRDIEHWICATATANANNRAG